MNTFRLPVFRLPEKSLLQWKAKKGRDYTVLLLAAIFWAMVNFNSQNRRQPEWQKENRNKRICVGALYKALLSNKGGLYDEVGAIMQRLAVWLKGKSLYFLGDVGGVRQPENPLS